MRAVGLRPLFPNLPTVGRDRYGGGALESVGINTHQVEFEQVEEFGHLTRGQIGQPVFSTIDEHLNLLLDGVGLELLAGPEFHVGEFGLDG